MFLLGPGAGLVRSAGDAVRAVVVRSPTAAESPPPTPEGPVVPRRFRRPGRRGQSAVLP